MCGGRSLDHFQPRCADQLRLGFHHHWGGQGCWRVDHQCGGDLPRCNLRSGLCTQLCILPGKPMDSSLGKACSTLKPYLAELGNSDHGTEATFYLLRVKAQRLSNLSNAKKFNFNSNSSSNCHQHSASCPAGFRGGHPAWIYFIMMGLGRVGKTGFCPGEAAQQCVLSLSCGQLGHMSSQGPRLL
jgi:hypothetical protein